MDFSVLRDSCTKQVLSYVLSDNLTKARLLKEILLYILLYIC